MTTSRSESGSVHSNLRSRLRLLGKSAMSLVRRTTGKRRERADTGPVTSCGRGRRDNVAAFLRWGRRVDAEEFRDNYKYDGSIDKRVYINSNGDTDIWEDKSVGCMWVAVYAERSICVVWKGDVEVDRFPITTQISYVRRLFALNVFSEIEDIKRSGKRSRQTLDKPVKKPFAVVSLIPNTTNVHQESGDEASGAVKYLKERMKTGLAFTRNETIQTAIYALQLQCNQEFTAEDIWVCMLEENDDFCLQRGKIEEHLTAINKPKPLQINEIEEPASTATEPPLHTNEIEEGPSTTIEPLLQTNEIEEQSSTHLPTNEN